MCGIFLILERNGAVNDARALAASKSLRHRGPDGSGQYRFQKRFARAGMETEVSGFLGHNRLSILDPQPRSDQPFRRRGRTLVHNGEIYNFRELRGELKRHDISFDTDSDTEVLLELLAHSGTEGLNQARGMWAFCLLDENTGRLSAARDRYGKKPLFYFFDASRLCIASEIAPICAYLGRPPGMVMNDLDVFLRHGWLFPGSGGPSHIDGISQVGAGASIEFDLASWQLTRKSYFSLADQVQGSAPDPRDLPEMVRDAVRERLVSDRRVGLLLSGGIDSSLILSVLHSEQLDAQISCFTGDAGKSDDARYARACIEQLGMQHISVPLDYGRASMDGFLEVCKHQEKPFPLIGNALAMPQLYAQIAAHNVPVVLDGTGGDEVFAGYWDRQHSFAMAEAIAAGDRDWLAAAIECNTMNAKFQAMPFGAESFGKLRSGRPAAQSPIVGGVHDPIDLASYLAESVSTAPSSDPLDDFVGTLGQALTLDAAQGRLHEWLWQNDRNAMACGIENRSPLLDHRLAPFMLSGYQRKFAGPWNKLELRNLFPSFITLPTQWRQDKQGFRWVYTRFLRQNKAQVLDLVAASRLLPQRVRVTPLLERAQADDGYLECSLLQRMLCIAGLEQSIGLTAAD